jgi:hypothetical protein
VEKRVPSKEKMANDESTELVLHLHNEEISLSNDNLKYTCIQDSQTVQSNIGTDIIEGDIDYEENVIETDVIIDDSCVQVNPDDDYP